MVRKLDKILFTSKAKYRDILKIFASLRLCPNKLRLYILKALGWRIGDGTIIHWGIIPIAPNVAIGNSSFLAMNAFLDGLGSITIGDRVIVGPFCRILSTTHPIESGPQRQIPGNDIDLHTRIESGCWLGTQVMVLPGVVIAHGCVIAAGAVVTRSTEPNGLYAGCPARRVKDLPINERPKEAGYIEISYPPMTWATQLNGSVGECAI